MELINSDDSTGSYNAWLDRASRGDELLRGLMVLQDDIYTTTTYRDPGSTEWLEDVSRAIKARQQELGIDPMVGPKYPKTQEQETQ